MTTYRLPGCCCGRGCCNVSCIQVTAPNLQPSGNALSFPCAQFATPMRLAIGGGGSRAYWFGYLGDETTSGYYYQAWLICEDKVGYRIIFTLFAAGGPAAQIPQAVWSGEYSVGGNWDCRIPLVLSLLSQTGFACIVPATDPADTVTITGSNSDDCDLVKTNVGYGSSEGCWVYAPLCELYWIGSGLPPEPSAGPNLLAPNYVRILGDSFITPGIPDPFNECPTYLHNFYLGPIQGVDVATAACLWNGPFGNPPNHGGANNQPNGFWQFYWNSAGHWQLDATLLPNFTGMGLAGYPYLMTWTNSGTWDGLSPLPMTLSPSTPNWPTASCSFGNVTVYPCIWVGCDIGVATVTNKHGCFIALPNALDWRSNDCPLPISSIGIIFACITAYVILTGAGSFNQTFSRINMSGIPPLCQIGSLFQSAEPGWTSTSAVFIFDDGLGNTATITFVC